MVMGYWSVAILFWQLSIDHIVNVIYKRWGLPKTSLRHPSLPFDSLPYPTRTICRRLRTYVCTLGQSRDNQAKRGWPYPMSMGLCPTRASREPRYYRSVLAESFKTFIFQKFRRPLCHKVNLPRCEARRRRFIMTCDIFGTGQTNILGLCYLFGKTYKQRKVAPLKSLKSTHSALAGEWFPYGRYHRCNRCDRWEKKNSAIAAIIAIIWNHFPAIAATTIAEI